jgi:hypothetical protein
MVAYLHVVIVQVIEAKCICTLLCETKWNHHIVLLLE